MNLKTAQRILGIAAVILTGLMAYNHMAYFPKSRGEVLEERVSNLLPLLKEVRDDVKVLRKGP